jgi:hypothetical protein
MRARFTTPHEAIGVMQTSGPICDRIELTVHRRRLPVEVGPIGRLRHPPDQNDYMFSDRS